MILDEALNTSIDLDFEIFFKINKSRDLLEINMSNQSQPENVISLKEFIKDICSTLNKCDNQRQVHKKIKRTSEYFL